MQQKESVKTKCEMNDNSIGAKQDCPEKAKLNEAKARKCKYTNLKIQAGEREYNSEKNKEGRFEIVCGDKVTFKSINCSLEELKGPPSLSADFCSHDGKVFDIDFDANVKTNDQLSFKAQTAFDTSTTGIISNFKSILWPPSAGAIEYDVNSNTCGNNNSVQVLAYPDLETSFSFKVKKEEGLSFVLLGEGQEENETILDDLFEGNIRKYFQGEFESKYDGKSFIKLNISKKDEAEKFTKLPSVQTLKYLYKGITECRDTLSKVLSKGDGSLTFSFSPLIGFSCKMEEDTDDVFVDYKAGVTLGFDPLLKFKGSYKLLGPVLGSIPGIGTALVAIKWLLAKCNAAEIDLQVSLEGSVSFTGSMNKTGKEWQGDIDPKGKVELKIEFVAKYTINISYGFGAYSRSGGFQATGKGGFKAEPIKDRKLKYKMDKDGIAIYMDLKFTGVYLYWLTGSTAGGAISTPGGIPGYTFKGEVSDMQKDEEMSSVPADQQYEVWPEKSLWKGYLNLTSE